MRKYVKISNLYVGKEAFKTDIGVVNIRDKKNIIAENIDGQSIVREQKRGIYLKKGKFYYSIMDVDKIYRLPKKQSRRFACAVLASSHLDRIQPGGAAIIKESLKKMNLLDEVCALGDVDNGITGYFSDNLNSSRVSLDYVKKMHKVIR